MTQWIEKMNGEHDISLLSRYNYRFHYELVQHSGSRVLIDNYPSYYVLMHSLQLIGYQKKRHDVQEPLEDHLAIVAALRNKDHARVVELLAKHCEHMIELIKSLM